MLLETMEKVLPGMRKYILKSESGDLINVIGSNLGQTGKSGQSRGGK